MTIDTKELRRIAQDFKLAGSPMFIQTTQMNELLDRLEAAESEAIEQARLNGMGSEREAALMAKLEAAEKTNRKWLRANAPGGWIDNLRIENEALRALRAKIAEMERQEPVAWLHETRRDSDVVTDAVKHVWGKIAVGSMAAYSIPLYALPGAKGEEK